jgi:hypothetical protein
MSILQLSDYVNRGCGEEIATLVGSVYRKRGCFIVHSDKSTAAGN